MTTRVPRIARSLLSKTGLLFAVILVLIGISCGQVDDAKVDLQLSSTSGGSVTTPGEGRFAYDQGAEVPLQAKAHPGFRFVSWSGNVDFVADINSVSTTVTVNASSSIRADFEALPPENRELWLESTEGGSVIVPGEGKFTRTARTIIDIRARADEGYRFAYWSGDIEHVGNVRAGDTIVFMEDDTSITAHFEPMETFDLVIDSTEGGSVTEPGEGTFSFWQGKTLPLVAEASEGFRFVNWSGDTDGLADLEEGY